MKFLCSLSYVGNLKKSLKIIQVVSPIEFTEAQINMDKGMSFSWKNLEFNHLIASLFQLSSSKFLCKSHMVCSWNELQENKQ